MAVVGGRMPWTVLGVWDGRCAYWDRRCPVAATACAYWGGRCPVGAIACAYWGRRCPVGATACAYWGGPCPVGAIACAYWGRRCPVGATACAYLGGRCPVGAITCACPLMAQHSSSFLCSSCVLHEKKEPGLYWCQWQPHAILSLLSFASGSNWVDDLIRPA